MNERANEKQRTNAKIIRNRRLIKYSFLLMEDYTTTSLFIVLLCRLLFSIFLFGFSEAVIKALTTRTSSALVKAGPLLLVGATVVVPVAGDGIIEELSMGDGVHKTDLIKFDMI